MKRFFLLFCLLAVLVLLPGCIKTPPSKDTSGTADQNIGDSTTGTGTSDTNKTGFSEALKEIEAVNEKFKDAKSENELGNYASELEAAKQSAKQKLEKEEDKKALEMFIAYLTTGAETRKGLAAALDSATPADLTNPKKRETIQSGIERTAGAIEAINMAINSAKKFRQEFAAQAAEANANADIASMEELKNNASELKKQLEKALENLPSFKEPKGGKSPTTFSIAKRIVVDEIVQGKNARVFAEEELLLPQTDVFEYAPTDARPLVWTTTERVWFFWIDDNLDMEFAHPVRYAFVKEATGEYLVFEGDWWPVIERESKFIKDITNKSIENLVYGEFKAEKEKNPTAFFQAAQTIQPPNVRCPCTQESKVYSIIIQGSEDMSFERNIRAVNNMLKGKGVDGNNIEYVGLASNTDGDVDKLTSKENIEKAFDAIKAKIRCCDILFIYITAHGGIRCEITWRNMWTTSISTSVEYNEKCLTQGSTSWGIWEVKSVDSMHYFFEIGGDNTIWDTQFDTMLDKIRNCNTFLFFQSCHSGGAIVNMLDKGRTIATSAEPRKSSFSGAPGKPSPVTDSFINAMNDSNASDDKDNDGTVSLEEAMRHARDNYDGKGTNRDSGALVMKSTDPCNCTDVCPGVTTTDANAGTQPDANTETPTDTNAQTTTMDFTPRILVDWIETPSITIDPTRTNHLVVQSETDWILPLTIKLFAPPDAAAPHQTITISDSSTQCGTTKMCSSDISTTGMTAGQVKIQVTDGTGKTGDKTVNATTGG